MQIEIEHPGAYPLARVEMDRGEEIVSESGAMVAMTSNMAIEGEARGGLLKALGRKLLAGESFFQSTIKASGSGHVLLAPASPGDVRVIEVDGSWSIQKGSFLAAERGVELSLKTQRAGQAFFGGEGFFILEARGKGKLLVSSFGAIHTIELGPGEDCIVDNGHLVAWTCDYQVEKAAAGWISSFKSGEGLVCRMKGPGTIHIQTRNLAPFAQSMIPFLPTRSSG